MKKTDVPYHACLQTPFAVLGVRIEGEHLVEVAFLPLTTPVMSPTNHLAEKVSKQMDAYLDDPDFPFDLPLDLRGTPHQRKVWQALRAIPRTAPTSYGVLAKQVGSAARAIGGACGANPVVVIVPCHRVLAANGALGGFMSHSSGEPLAIKRWLLQHESR